jgi:hypothetical protein
MKRNPTVCVTPPEDRPYIMAGVAPVTGTLRTLHGVRVVEVSSENYVSECLRFEAVRYVASRDGTGFTGWIVRSCTSSGDYSDPISTKRDALAALAERSAEHPA